MARLCVPLQSRPETVSFPMRIVVSSFCLFLLTVTFGIAGIEKSYDQCISLYGEPVGGKDDTWVFFAGDLVYVCDFDDKKVCKGMMATTQSKLPLTKAEN
ncbi:MAG: hypothetical protein P1V20_21995 [Verrucomicrobiales bacterium]|nr:hypothetical protein [Verrucomicrobiales bacterium]